MNKKEKKIIVILGQTATGKTDLSIKIALWLNSEKAQKEFNIKGAEIVSADSRQVYKGMDIGTGKITKKEMKNIPHHLLNIASPKRKFTIAKYQKLAYKSIDKILKKEKIPILVGGSPFYIYSIIENWNFPKVKPDWQLRKKLEKKTTNELFETLKKIDPQRAKKIDKNNKRRLIRAIEISKALGKVPKLNKNSKYNFLLIGITKEKNELKILIDKRLKKRFKQGMIKEVENLNKSGVSWKQLEEFGLEYKWIAKYLQGKITKKEMVEKLQKDIEKFAKRQMTWFKRDKKIKWVENYSEVKNIIKTFLLGK
ncbi:MAG: tRNA (adenosine(37)-N6)-dimethylallyltransferase MiaA [Candidatus Pacebacteria bacterium]|nr:tRNA (adenosine(37)-N6)-dimethylallyltransferase MiaA [Candidatus Paceibacterota bacterium]